ncbi:MAG: hypothetical protein IT323_05565 [Anaerolineae bacterium]|nr:hypothetical protein [Anaerolineae bacterium]
MRLTCNIPVALAALALIAVFAVAAPARAGSPLEREYSVSIMYEAEHTYAGRLANARAAFAMLQVFFDSDPFAPDDEYSFLRDVLRNTMLPEQGYVMTQYGFGYGACGAPSLLNHLARTAVFLDADGTEQPVFEVIQFTRERNPTYGRYGAAIFLDLTGPRSKDYVWRLNPAYDGPMPRITITIDDADPEKVTVTMTMRYGDEAALPAPTLTPTASRTP